MSEKSISKTPSETKVEKDRVYIAIDLKSFYASVECVERKLDALTTHLVVADESRTEKTICLAVSPSLKEYQIPGRARLFEVVSAMRQVNEARRTAMKRTLGRDAFSGRSYDARALAKDPSLEAAYLVAPPRMALYIDYSTRIYRIYLRYIAPEDIHVYSIDEVFMDVTDYLRTYQMTPHELARRMMREVLEETGITATAGIAPNLFLCKAAMDIVAKHIPADPDGVRVVELDERGFREKLWTHRPLTDFWRIGRGYARRLEAQGLYTMGDIARCSIGGEKDYYNEALLYRMFGINAELLIDHAWGWEPCTMAEIKAYRPADHSMGSGQVLPQPYSAGKGRLVVHEMADLLALDLLEKQLVTDQVVLTVGYDIENLTDPSRQGAYRGEVKTDHYGRKVPKSAHGSRNLGGFTDSSSRILSAVLSLYDEIVDPALLVRRMYVYFNHVRNPLQDRAFENRETNCESSDAKTAGGQMDLFRDYGLTAEHEISQQEEEDPGKERRLQEAVLSLRRRYGKNAVLKGMNLEEGATTRLRNEQIGGHKA